MFARNFAALPNLITLGRLFLVPVIIVAITNEYWVAAFVIFVIAGVSDGVDGWLAKTFHLQSELGAFLDPLADKALLVSIYVTLGISHTIPAALAILVVSRDLLIVAGVMTAWLFDRPVEIKPIAISKINTAGQIAFAAYILASLAFNMTFPAITTFAVYSVAALTLASATAYLTLWIKHMDH